LEEILDRVYEWGVEFSRSKYFEGLTEEQKKKSEFVVMSFTEYIYYYGVSPEEWDEDGLEECCLYTLPRKVTADDLDIDLPLVLEGKVISEEEISRMIML